MNELRPHKVVGLVKFMTTKEEFKKLAARLISEVAQDPTKMVIDFDQIIVLGTVEGRDVFEIRFVKFIDDEQQQVRQIDNGDPGQ